MVASPIFDLEMQSGRFFHLAPSGPVIAGDLLHLNRGTPRWRRAFENEDAVTAVSAGNAAHAALTRALTRASAPAEIAAHGILATGISEQV